MRLLLSALHYVRRHCDRGNVLTGLSPEVCPRLYPQQASHMRPSLNALHYNVLYCDHCDMLAGFSPEVCSWTHPQ